MKLEEKDDRIQYYRDEMVAVLRDEIKYKN